MDNSESSLLKANNFLGKENLYRYVLKSNVDLDFKSFFALSENDIFKVTFLHAAPFKMYQVGFRAFKSPFK